MRHDTDAKEEGVKETKSVKGRDASSRLRLFALGGAVVFVATAALLMAATATFTPGHSAYSAHIQHLPPANGKAHLPGESDTRVIVRLNYGKMRDIRDMVLYRGVQNGSLSKEDEFSCRYFTPFRLVDAQDKEYKLAHPAVAETLYRFGECLAIYSFDASDIRTVAGTVRLQSRFTDCKGWEQDISVVVRQ